MGPSSIIGAVAVRIARLTANGTPDFNNATGGLAMCGGISSFQHDFEVEDGADMFVEDGGGNACVVRKKPDRTKRATFTLTLCRSDYRVDEILGVAQAVTLSGSTVGRAVRTNAGCGTAVANNGVSIELWSEQWDCDVAMTNMPYMRTILPRCYLTPAGFTRENDVAMPVYNGFAVANNNWGDGPFGDADVLTGITGWCLADIDDPALPYCPPTFGYINIPPTAS